MMKWFAVGWLAVVDISCISAIATTIAVDVMYPKYADPLADAIICIVFAIFAVGIAIGIRNILRIENTLKRNKTKSCGIYGVRIKDIVKEALNGFLSLDLANKTAERIAEKAKEEKLVLMEERFCTWNDFKKEKPDVWVNEAGKPIEFAIRRIGMIDSELAHFDGKRFYWIEKGFRFYYQAVTHWVQMPRLLGYEDNNG